MADKRLFTRALGLSVSARTLYDALKPDISYPTWVNKFIRNSYFLKREYADARYLVACDEWVNDIFISIPMAHSLCILQRGNRSISVRNELSVTYREITLKINREHQRRDRPKDSPIEIIRKRARYWAITKIDSLISNGTTFDSDKLHGQINKSAEEFTQELDKALKRRFPGDTHLFKNGGLKPCSASFVENWQPQFFELIAGGDGV